MANETQIVNMALSLLGDKRINTFGDTDTEEGRVSKLFYEQVRDEVVVESGVEWRAGLSRAGPLAVVTDKPKFGWEFAYQVPTDPKALRVLAMVSDTNDVPLKAAWKREGNLILTNEDEVHILYIKQITDAGMFPPLVVRAIFTKLAATMAGPLTADRQLTATLLESYYTLALPDAIRANASEGFIENEAGDNDWTTVGRS